MVKYTKIDSVLNHVSNMVKEQADVPQLLSYANQAWRRLELPNVQYDLKVAVLEVNAHKANLPPDVKKIVGIYTTTSPMPPDSYDMVIEVNNVDRTVYLQQQLLLSAPSWTSTFQPLVYVGQNKSAIIDESLYCPSCGYGFSVDAQLKCLTIDNGDNQTDPYDIIIEYWATLKDDDCNVLIPDDTTLLEGLAAWISHKVFDDMADRQMGGARERSMYYMQISQNLLNRFRGKVHLMNIQPALHEQFRNRRFNVPQGYWNYSRNGAYDGLHRNIQ